MSIIGKSGQWDEQFNLAYELYDINTTGKVTIEAIRQGSAYEHCDAVEITEKEYASHDLDQDGLLNIDEFKNLCRVRQDLVSNVVQALSNIFYTQLEKIKEENKKCVVFLFGI